MKNAGLCLLGCALALAACSSEVEGDEHAGHDMSDMSGEMDHSKHMAGPLSDKAVKDKKEAADMLVARFGVEACAEADLIGSLRRTSPEEGETMMRAFQAPVSCGEETIAAVRKAGFAEGEPGVFTGTSAEGTAEEIKIQMIGEGDEAAATVEWQATQK